MHANSKAIFSKYAAPRFRRRDVVLEIGPESIPSWPSEQVEAAAWRTLDIAPRVGVDFQECPEANYPIASNTFDVIYSSQVVEHVRRPWEWIRELARICKPGGLVITVCPVTWTEHRCPLDCWRIYPDGMQALYDWASLTVELIRCECLTTEQAIVLPGGVRTNTILDCLAIGRK